MAQRLPSFHREGHPLRGVPPGAVSWKVRTCKYLLGHLGCSAGDWPGRLAEELRRPVVPGASIPLLDVGRSPGSSGLTAAFPSKPPRHGIIQSLPKQTSTHTSPVLDLETPTLDADIIRLFDRHQPTPDAYKQQSQTYLPTAILHPGPLSPLELPSTPPKCLWQGLNTVCRYHPSLVFVVMVCPCQASSDAT